MSAPARLKRNMELGLCSEDPGVQAAFHERTGASIYMHDNMVMVMLEAELASVASVALV
jgi:hypothetical protein